MSRFRLRPEPALVQPAPGTILPGVPLVGWDVGPLIPQQREHDPLSAADRSAVVLEQMVAAHELAADASRSIEPVHAAEDEVLIEAAVDPPVVVASDVVESGVESAVADDESIEGVLDDSPAIDDALLDAVVSRMPLPIHPTSALMVRPPAPERVKLMVGVLARDFERFGTRADPTPPSSAVSPASTPVAEPIWGPWPEPHTSAWPVVVPPWGQIPRSFARPLPESLASTA